MFVLYYNDERAERGDRHAGLVAPATTADVYSQPLYLTPFAATPPLATPIPARPITTPVHTTCGGPARRARASGGACSGGSGGFSPLLPLPAHGGWQWSASPSCLRRPTGSSERLPRHVPALGIVERRSARTCVRLCGAGGNGRGWVAGRLGNWVARWEGAGLGRAGCGTRARTGGGTTCSVRPDVRSVSPATLQGGVTGDRRCGPPCSHLAGLLGLGKGRWASHQGCGWGEAEVLCREREPRATRGEGGCPRARLVLLPQTSVRPGRQ